MQPPPMAEPMPIPATAAVERAGAAVAVGEEVCVRVVPAEAERRVLTEPDV